MNGIEKEKWHRRFVHFLRDVRAELRKVTWPSRNEVTSTTIVVIVSTLFFGFYLFFIDIISSWILTKIEGLLG